MKAKELFEKLNCELPKDDDYKKEWSIAQEYTILPKLTSSDELDTINQQLKELGWDK